MAKNQHTGKEGERLAKLYLEKKGFAILHQNWRHSYYEVDIIASRENVLHFVEVKTRISENYGYPEENVSRKKLENLIEAAEEYQEQFPAWEEIQFDILSIVISNPASPDFFFIEDVYPW